MLLVLFKNIVSGSKILFDAVKLKSSPKLLFEFLIITLNRLVVG